MSETAVKINQGALKGVILETEFGKVKSFFGIPYAEPPTGELRFKDPQPPKSWDGVRDASKEGGISIQNNPFNHQNIGDDDCLYLNVFTKNLTGKKPVMVWIHGGGFTYSSSSISLYRPDYIVRHDVVFVSMNYRLGIIGFLNMGVENCTGNQGLKDQVFALKWVQENIEKFGGDKNNVTIFGESAGSASVHYLSISPLAKGLFHKAILQSGVCNNPWGFQLSNKEYAMKIAAELGNSSTDPKEVVKFLKNFPAKEILSAQNKLFGARVMNLNFLFVPTVDDKSPNPFLPKPLEEMVQNGIEVPVIIGYNSHEGIPILEDCDSESGDFYKKCDQNFEGELARILKLNSRALASQLAKEVKNYYFKGKPITKEEKDVFVQFSGNIFFTNGILRVLEIQSQKKTPTYFYKYLHDPQFSIVKLATNLTNEKGACHADELTHLFYMSFLSPEMQLQNGTTDYILMEYMTKMWTDFAKTGNPTPNDSVKIKWPSYLPDRKSCLHIKENLSTVENFEEESWKFWKPLLNNYKLF